MIIIPAEWTLHRATWAAWPSHVDSWFEQYLPAREEITPMIKALAKSERVKLLATGDEAVNDARLAFDNDHVDVIHAAFGTIWLHDTGPLFAKDKYGPQALCLGFNGWGGRQVAKYDDEVSGFIARATGLRMKQLKFFMEGGAIEVDGEGRALVSRDCLLDPKRNPDLTLQAATEFLQTSLGLKQIIWLDGSLVNDPSGGHVNTLARFVGPGKVVCQTAATSDDPNAALYEETATLLKESGLDVVTLPSAGRILGPSSTAAPASHMNFVIGNHVVILPSYEGFYSKEAAKVLQSLFPERQVLTLPANHLLTGGRSFHAMTRAEPSF